MKTLTVHTLINSKFAVKTEDGDLIYKKIIEEFSQSNNIKLDFSDIFLMTTAFLNAAIGQFYSNDSLYNQEFLSKHLELANVQKEDLPLFKLVIERAKEYFKERNDLDNFINSNFYGN